MDRSSFSFVHLGEDSEGKSEIKDYVMDKDSYYGSHVIVDLGHVPKGDVIHHWMAH